MLKLSAWAARALFSTQYHAQLLIDIAPEKSDQDWLGWFEAVKQASPKKQLVNVVPEGCPRRFWEATLNYLEISTTSLWADLSKKNMNRLLEAFKNASFEVSGKGVFKEEFVTSGGIDLSEVSMSPTANDMMQSKKIPGLFFAGEILNIDGLTGGFNFQNAWTTGYLAGQSAARFINH